jgi:hypothetical protein
VGRKKLGGKMRRKAKRQRFDLDAELRKRGPAWLAALDKIVAAGKSAIGIVQAVKLMAEAQRRGDPAAAATGPTLVSFDPAGIRNASEKEDDAPIPEAVPEPERQPDEATPERAVGVA